jgi:phosphatidate phosphatase APP1
MPLHRRMFARTLGLGAAMLLTAASPPRRAGAQSRPSGTKTRTGPSRRPPTLMAFDTVGHLDASGDFWHVPSEIWAYRPQDSSVRKGLIAALFRNQYGLTAVAANQAIFDRRVNLLLANNVGRITPVVRIGSEVPDYPATGANGHTQLSARIPVYPATPIATGARIPIEVTDGVGGVVYLVPEEGLSIISDIDDTVKDSGVLDKRRLWDATFFQPFKAVAGMPALVTRLAGKTGVVHYVSSTPWHLYAPLREWLEEEKYPVSSLHLKQIRLKDMTIFDIFKSPETLKPPVIAGLVQRWPRRRFVLIGDSGEKDPEVYGAIAWQFPNQIARILIRRAPGDTSGPSRFDAAFSGISRDLWQVFDTPDEVTWTP